MYNREIVGIVVTGSPAPGLNAVIASATNYAYENGWRVIGFHDGYKHLMTGDPDIVQKNTLELDPVRAERIMREGGSVLRTDRSNPTKSPTTVANSFKMLRHFKIRYLLAIGGNQKICNSFYLMQGVDPTEIAIIVVPKSIANDIPIPVSQSTFGYHTARVFATELIHNLMADTEAVHRWFIVEVMGRHTGHLALSVAEAAGAQLCIIPEQFGDKKVQLRDFCDVIEAAIIKRLANGNSHGCCIISEGLFNQLTEDEQKTLYGDQEITTDASGELSIDEANLSRAIRDELVKRMNRRELPIRLNPKKIGYELRGANPLSLDSIYGRELGYGAIQGFKNGHSHCIVAWEDGEISYHSFRSLIDQSTGLIIPRKVDLSSPHYKVACSYMAFLKRSDLSDAEKLERLAAVVNISPDQFLADFGHVPDLVQIG